MAAGEPRRLTLPASFAASALAASLSCIFTNPFVSHARPHRHTAHPLNPPPPQEVVKTRLQLDGEGALKATHVRQYRGIAHAFSTIARLEGLRGLQAGLVPALCYQTAMNGTRLGLYEPVQRALVAVTGADPASTLMKAAAAAASGAVGATLGSPLYLVKSRLQAQSAFFTVREAHAYRGLWHGLSSVFAAEGARGLFRGLNGALPRVMTGSAVQLSSYDTCKAHAAAAGVAPGTLQHLVASLLASVLTVTAMNPWDVISTRLYQSQGKHTVYSGPFDCAAKTVRAEGWAALQKGWLAQYGRLGPHTVLTFLFLEKLRPLAQRVDAFVEA